MISLPTRSRSVWATTIHDTPSVTHHPLLPNQRYCQRHLSSIIHHSPHNYSPLEQAAGLRADSLMIADLKHPYRAIEKVERSPLSTVNTAYHSLHTTHRHLPPLTSHHPSSNTHRAPRTTHPASATCLTSTILTHTPHTTHPTPMKMAMREKKLRFRCDKVYDIVRCAVLCESLAESVAALRGEFGLGHWGKRWGRSLLACAFAWRVPFTPSSHPPASSSTHLLHLTTSPPLFHSHPLDPSGCRAPSIQHRLDQGPLEQPHQ